MFARQLRKLCWRIQKDLTKVRGTDITEITSQLSGTPDLSGLIDMDSMLLEAGFISSRELDDKEDDESFEDYRTERNSQATTHLDGNGDSYYSDLHGRLDDDTRTSDDPDHSRRKKGDSKNKGKALRTGSLINSVTSAFNSQAGKSRVSSSGMYSRTSSVDGEQIAQRERQLERDLRIMTQKCVELNMQLKEERSNLELLTSRSGNINHKKLTHELLALQKEKDLMMHNAKAAAWKLEELHVVNKIMYKKAQESQQQVQFLEEGFQRLQETFRATALDSLDGETKLREEIARLELTLDALTVPEGRRMDPDLDAPLPRINLTIRGTKRDPNQIVRNGLLQGPGISRGIVPLCKSSRKGKDHKIVVRKPHQIKRPRPCKRYGTSIGGRHKKAMRMKQMRTKTIVLLEADGIVDTVFEALH